jgi:glycosyltransferase involved in cell wall biosynthesis
MGMQHYQLQLLRALEELTHEDASWCFSTLAVDSMRGDAPDGHRLPLRLVEAAPYGFARAVGRLTYGRPDLVHRFDLRLPPPASAEVVTVHDLPPLHFPDEGAMPGWALRSARSAGAVICPSRFAADEVRNVVGDVPTIVTPNGLHPAFDAGAETPVQRAVEGPYVLHAGGATARKNLAALADAWRSVQPELPDVTLVLVGPPDPRRDAAFAGVDVVTMGYQPIDVVARVMRGAEAVVVPSVYEGFGLPALEAMALGTPVVAARRGALPEVCGDAALLVEPDADGLAEGLIRAIRDDTLRAGLRDRGRAQASSFTWRRSAEGHLEAYRLGLR